MFGVIWLTSAFTILSNNWNVDNENYKVNFTSKKFNGGFKGLKANLVFNENDLPASKLSASIDASTISTGSSLRDKHARQGLDAEKYQTIKFESESIVKGANGYTALGKLYIKDVIKAIKIPFTFTKTTNGGVFEGGFNIKPEEYNVTKMGTPEEIDIQLNIPVTQ